MHRIYIDEVGNADLESSSNPNHRYLSLTGVIMDVDYATTVVTPRLEQLKRKHFDSDSEYNPVILHRSELVNKRGVFGCLRDGEKERSFNSDLLSLLQEATYTIITAVIDKQEHYNKYQIWRFHPYHYCMTVIIERYARWMMRRKLVGDVMVESRGKKEDNALAASYERIYNLGTNQIPPRLIQKHLTSKQLKLKTKSANLAGLQMADLLAHPSYRAALARVGGGEMTAVFGREVAKILTVDKYDRSPGGDVMGWGIKILP